MAETLLTRATTLFGHVNTLARSSVKLGRRRGRQLARRGKNLFEMGYHLTMVATYKISANLVQGLEHLKQRDFPEPKTYKQAVEGEYGRFWQESIQEELANLEDHKIWEWVDLPPGRHCIDSVWKFKAKPNNASGIDRLKSRLCARGFKQRWGVDFTETHAPVTVMSAWRANVAEMSQRRWSYDIFDVSGAYLHSDLIEELYILPPTGMPIPKGCENKVLRLRKALYGLKQAGRAWRARFLEWLEKHGFKVADADSSMFLKSRWRKGKEQTMRMNVYVDDAFVVTNNMAWYNQVKRELRRDFRLSPADDDNQFLGIAIVEMHDKAWKLHQTRYIDDLCSRFELTKEKRETKVPYRNSWKLTKAMGPETEKAKREMQTIPFRSLIGGLLYIANGTRPDVAAAVGICAQFCANPGKKHWEAALLILKYLRDTREMGIVFGRPQPGIPYAPLIGYADASWGDNPDDRSSRTGIMLWSWGGPIEWSSKKQRAIALSSTEAEYMAAASAVQSVVWGRRLFEEFGYTDLGILDSNAVATEEEQQGHRPTVIFEDNTGCISWSKNPGTDHQRSKHIDLKYHYIQSMVKKGVVKMVYCPTAEMMADILTKYLPAPRFTYLRDKMVWVKIAVVRY